MAPAARSAAVLDAVPANDGAARLLEGALEEDDICDAAAGSSCELSLRQLRGERVAAAVARHAAEAAEAAAPVEPSPDFSDVLFFNVTGLSDDPEGEEGNGAGTKLGAENSVSDPSQSCASPLNSDSADCYLYHACQGRAACVINGYLVVPGAPLRGMEDINGANAAQWDFLFSVAQGQCGSPSCVIITNPVHHRTQHQMHLHYRQYNDGGAALKSRLEKALCGSSGWRPFSECGSAKARLFDSTPGVFSSVAAAYGGGSLAHVGITVWFTSACGGGLKTMILATTHCSIEHSISAR